MALGLTRLRVDTTTRAPKPFMRARVVYMLAVKAWYDASIPVVCTSRG